jgi:5'-nucleotidase
MRTKSSWIAVVVLALGIASPAAARRGPLRVLVTNDDGIAADGLAALVGQLALNRSLSLSVVAPDRNRSGAGERTTTTDTLDVEPAIVAGGVPALQVSGFPADCVLFAVHKGLALPPDLVVSGINNGQNIAEAVAISGTVGAAITAARLGIPAIAVSQGVGDSISYVDAAVYVAGVVERLRKSSSLRRRLASRAGLGQALVLNVNFPTCLVGSRRGLFVVPLGRGTVVTDYALTADDGRTKTWTPVVQTVSLLESNCTSTLVKPTTDLEAMRNGFAAVTPLRPDLTVDARTLRSFRFLRQ